jgi:hypothetical protein
MQPTIVHRGSHGDYFWLVSGPQIHAICDLIVRFHPGQRLCVIAFDGGRIEVLGFLWTVQLLIFKGKDGRSDGPNTAQEDQVTTLLL